LQLASSSGHDPREQGTFTLQINMLPLVADAHTGHTQ
jgi:hypothetical protein